MTWTNNILHNLLIDGSLTKSLHYNVNRLLIVRNRISVLISYCVQHSMLIVVWCTHIDGLPHCIWDEKSRTPMSEISAIIPNLFTAQLGFYNSRIIKLGFMAVIMLYLKLCYTIFMLHSMLFVIKRVRKPIT